MAATDGKPDAGRAVRRPHGVLEAEVMAALRAGARPMSPAEVHAAVGGLAYSTVTTILHRLHSKGLAARQRHGRGYAYAPSVQDSARTAHAMHDLLRQGADRTAVLAEFVSGLSAGDEQLLQQMLRAAGEVYP